MPGSEASMPSPRRVPRSYTTYSIGCAIAWGFLWLILALKGNHTTNNHVLYVFLGWVIGWTSATIARAVYPPPGSFRRR
jgi:hypothetical protein